MPDPYRFAITLAASMAASFFWFWAIGRTRRPAAERHETHTRSAVLGVTCGAFLSLVIGYLVLGLTPRFPPRIGLDRLLVIVLPGAVLLESLLAAFVRTSRRVALVRLVWAMASVWILLFDSVYLRTNSGEWNGVASVVTLLCCGLTLAVVWCAVQRIDRLRGGPEMPLALSMSILCGGMLAMLGGYIKGGSAALPLAGAMLGFAVVRRPSSALVASSVANALGVVGLFGIVFVGCFFGRVGSVSAVVTVIAPLLAGLPLALPITKSRVWLRTIVALLLVAIPLSIVLAHAKYDFDQRMAPLLK